MKYIANPVIVEAFRIEAVGVSSVVLRENVPGEVPLRLENGVTVMATPEMTARYTPAAGDYWVVQSDGYTYLNPATVFERKYFPLVTGEHSAEPVSAALQQWSLVLRQEGASNSRMAFLGSVIERVIELEEVARAATAVI